MNSIFDNGRVAFDLRTVISIERLKTGGLQVIFLGSKWNDDVQQLEPNVYLYDHEESDFINQWKARCLWKNRQDRALAIYGPERLSDIAFYIQNGGHASIPPLDCLERCLELVDQLETKEVAA